MKAKLLFAVALFVATLSSSCQSQPKCEMVDYCANNAEGNPITGECAEYYDGVTYFAYQGEKGDPYVMSYDHENAKWNGPYKAGTSLLCKDPNKKFDSHGKPSLVVDSKGYIHVVFGGHGGTPDLGVNELGNYNGGKQIHVKSKKPLDISEWEEVDNITPFGTYSQFVKMDNGDIYLFYRHGAHRSNWIYQVSKDDCRTFSPKTSFLKAKPTIHDGEKLNEWDSWYIAFEKGLNDEIIVLYSYHHCRSKNGVHIGERRNGYYMTLDTKSNTWHNIKGEELQLPLDKEYSDTMTMCVNTNPHWSHLGDVGIDKSGRPRVYWYEGKGNGEQYGGRKRLATYYYDGTEWVGGDTNLPVEARGEMVAESVDSIKHLLASTDGKKSEIAWYSSVDAGKTFKKDEVVLESEGKGYTMSHFVRNANPEAFIVVTKKIDNSPYSQVMLLGENGVIQRAKSDAETIVIE